MRLASISAAVACVLLGACGDGPGDDGDDDPMAPTPDAAPQPMRWLSCEHQGTTSVFGTGPAGPLLGYRVYPAIVSGFCPLSLGLVVAPEVPLSYPYLEGTITIWASLPEGSIFGTADWSGTFPAKIHDSNGDTVAAGEVEVTSSTPASAPIPSLRATATFNDAGWSFTASIDAPYCNITNCI